MKSENALNALERALEELQPNSARRASIDFVEAYHVIEQHLERKVPFKSALETFNQAYGHTLHPQGFRKMLSKERKRREEIGEVVACTACGKYLRAAGQAGPSTDNSVSNGGEA